MKTSFQKKYYVAAALLISAVAGAFYATEVSAAWPTTKSTLCWSVSPGVFVKAQITPMGGGFYTTNHIAVEKGGIINIGTGTAYIKGNSVYWTIADAGKDSVAMSTSISFMVLNKNTLIGKSESIYHDKNYADDSLDTEYQVENTELTTPVPCNSIWQ